MPTIQCYPSGPLTTNAYILGCQKTNKGIIIDPAPFSADSLIQGCLQMHVHVEAVLLTHSHWDHIGDLKKIQSHFNVPVYVHPSDRENVVKPGSDRLPLIYPIEGIEPDFDLEDNAVFQVGHLELRVITTPGHTPGSVCFYLSQEKVLFSGDTLFKGSIGSTSLPTGEPHKIWQSLQTLKRLPDETVVYPGHGLTTTIGQEKHLTR